MRSLDFHFQKIVLIILISFFTLSLFNEIGMVVWIGMFLFGIYHLLHFILYFLSKVMNKQKIGRYMVIYPIMNILYFISWYQFHNEILEPYSWHLFGILALLIGSYYFFNVHKNNLDTSLRYY